MMSLVREREKRRGLVRMIVCLLMEGYEDIEPLWTQIVHGGSEPPLGLVFVIEVYFLHFSDIFYTRYFHFLFTFHYVLCNFSL